MKVHLELVMARLELVRIFNAGSSFNKVEIQKYYQYVTKHNGVYSRNNLPKIKDRADVINLDKYKSEGTHWIALHVNDNNVTYFDKFGVEHISKEIKKLKKNKNITNIYRLQGYNSIMCRCFYTGFIDFMLKGKSLLDYKNLFSPNDYEKNDKIILKYFQ